MRARNLAVVAVLGILISTCSSGKTGTSGSFRLIQFLEAGQDSIPRNRILTFRFSGPVSAGQDLAERLKIQNVQSNPNSNFSKALGVYFVDADQVTFAPQLPNETDRSDAGFRDAGSYVVFVKAGPDALASTTGDQITRQQEFDFVTNEFFEDPIPTDPPRALGLVARDTTNGATHDISRVDPRPAMSSLADSADLIAAGNVVDPGGGSDYATPWRFELIVAEPIDPVTVGTENIELWEMFADATTSAVDAPPSAPVGHYGTPVGLKVPLNVKMDQGLNAATGLVEIRITVTPFFSLVDDSRYQIRFSGNLLGIDFRQEFVGTNGLTGDGTSILAGVGNAYPEPGGLGYTSDFIVRDRPTVTSMRTLEYQPLIDGILPEQGQTTTDISRYNSAAYDRNTAPGMAVGFLSAFGQGIDGDFAVSGGITLTIDTGDTLNEDVGNPFDVTDLDPTDMYQTKLPGMPRTWDSPASMEFQLSSMVVSSGSRLEIRGRNPVIFRVLGITQIQGTIDVSGSKGEDGGGKVVAGGIGGPGGFKGGDSSAPSLTLSQFISGCISFQAYLSAWGGGTFPHSMHGDGPGRGYSGGEGAGNGNTALQNYNMGTGGGGGSHATSGEFGEDIISAGSAEGSDGKCNNGTWNVKNSGFIGVRGAPGTRYGDPGVDQVTLGGSGGGAGGCTYSYYAFGAMQGGGGGGGGAGSLTILSAGQLLASGVLDASGGAGGAGSYLDYQNNATRRIITGAGGGGSGGSIVLVSGDSVVLSSALLDATGGAGGARATPPGSCNLCNRGGAGGNGFIFLMDADGEMTGLVPFLPGTYPNFATGYLTISKFDASRFGGISAITELFNVHAANPTFTAMLDEDVVALVNEGQALDVYMSSAETDLDDPTLPDISTETTPVLIAEVTSVGGSSKVTVIGDMSDLNTTGRNAYCRVDARFKYSDLVDAAVGPYASIDRVDIRFEFNG